MKVYILSWYVEVDNQEEEEDVIGVYSSSEKAICEMNVRLNDNERHEVGTHGASAIVVIEVQLDIPDLFEVIEMIRF